ncbi:MAG: DUF2478 domain-containing protein [Candidatus Bipolaricaulota bacterium]|nr:DUF2478 domain-containing protein [Candidatus Bipolaricaulota bacterium]MDW8126828.1 nucleoside-triphosphatase [Candidatus Bipolaricaulota bacterium]
MRDLLYTAFRQAYHTGKRGLIVTGPIGSGKTQAVSTLAEILGKEGWRVAGVVAPRILRGRETVGYLVRDISTEREILLCSLTPPGTKFRRFYFSPEALAFANKVLLAAAKEAEVVVIDEVGPLELSGNGFAPGLIACVRSPAYLVLTARPHIVEEVLRWLSVDLAIVRLTDE